MEDKNFIARIIIMIINFILMKERKRENKDENDVVTGNVPESNEPDQK